MAIRNTGLCSQTSGGLQGCGQEKANTVGPRGSEHETASGLLTDVGSLLGDAECVVEGIRLRVNGPEPTDPARGAYDPNCLLGGLRCARERLSSLLCQIRVIDQSL